VDEFKTNSIEIKKFDDAGWQITNDASHSINDKIEKKGTILKDWKGLEFYRGVTTGYNEAFHIDLDTKNQIELNDPESRNIIKPLLRGKDIKKYRYYDTGISMIFTNKGIEIEKYKGAKNHLSKFHDDLKPKTNNSDKLGRKPGNYKWYEIQDNTAYYKEFENDKIIWMEISDKANFTLDTKGMYLTNSAYFISGKNLKYLLAVLNSKVCDFYFFQKTALIAGGRKRYTKQYVEQNPIPIIPDEQQQPFIELVNKILEIKKENSETDTTSLEQEIDQLVYQLYELTPEEIKIIEGS
jgi:hypothetical protein